MQLSSIAIVTRPTRLEGLKRRWGTVGQAQFLLAQAHAHEDDLRAKRAAPVAAPGVRRQKKAATPARAVQQHVDFGGYAEEDRIYQQIVDRLEDELQFGLPVKRVDRAYLATFDFAGCSAVVVVGQDGLVANTAKYVGDIPLIAINPDPQRFDGVLLPFRVEQARAAVQRTLDGKYRSRRVTLAEVNLNDGQRMLAFNDLFIGAASHVSARYTLEVGAQAEPQSSSGVIVSTGAGSTGWLSSVFNMAGGVAQFLGLAPPPQPKLTWEDRRLLWAVREPFVSRTSQASLVAGFLDAGEELLLESLMPEGGVIFSDGVEADFLAFNTGVIARIRVSDQQANLVIAAGR